VIKGKAAVDGLGEGGGFFFVSNGLKFIGVVHVEHVHDEASMWQVTGLRRGKGGGLSWSKVSNM
jgi:hypothetical protein